MPPYFRGYIRAPHATLLAEGLKIEFFRSGTITRVKPEEHPLWELCSAAVTEVTVFAQEFGAASFISRTTEGCDPLIGSTVNHINFWSHQSKN